MAATSRIRLRRSAAQMHALAQVEREIRASDPALRRKYLREFNFAFQTYERVLSRADLDERLLRSDVILVGDYHALPASQAYAAQVVEQLAARSGRPLILGVETVFSRDQHILDEWQAGQIDEFELRERIRYDLDWGYDWQPFYRLLSRAKAAGARIYGLDCMPRGDLRRISARDRHAADKLALLQEANPTAQFVVLFGESHLAPQHLPELVKEKLVLRDVLTVLQNVDSLYWRAAGEPDEQVEAVSLSDDVVCVFNSTPLEKYESYRQCIERWRRERPGAIDLAPTFYNLIDALLRFLNVDKYSPKSIHHPSFLVDLLPEVYSLNSREALRRLLQRKGATDAELRQVLTGTDRCGAAYVPRLNAVFVTRFELLSGAEEATRFVHAALRGAVGAGTRPLLPSEPTANEGASDDPFYAAVLERALAYFGSRVLYPARAAIREVDLFGLYAQTSEKIEEQTHFNYRDYMQMIDFLVMHKDFESNARSYFEVPELIEQGRNYSDEQLEFVVEKLGGMLGSELYDAYLAGKVHKRYIRSLFFRDLRKPGAAHTLYFAIARRLKPARKRVF
jgi:hypothetical protein